jgi:hypothetical protein
LNSGEEVPPLNIAWQKDVVEIQKNKKRVLEQQQTIPQYFMGQITEHLGRKPQLPRKGVGL